MSSDRKPQWRNVSLYKDFLLGGLATMGACLFSNPIEVVKTRLQLQGELKLTTKAERPYKGVFHAFRVILANEGLRGIQSGLVPAVIYQFFMNSSRLGSYTVLKHLFGTDQPNTQFAFLRNVLAGATAGMIGGVVASPFFLVKTRIQAYSPNPQFAVGVQHKYNGMVR